MSTSFDKKGKDQIATRLIRRQSAAHLLQTLEPGTSELLVYITSDWLGR